mgnify:CR=1 FL=1
MIKQDLIDRLPELSVDQLMITLIQAEMVFAFSKTVSTTIRTSPYFPELEGSNDLSFFMEQQFMLFC